MTMAVPVPGRVPLHRGRERRGLKLQSVGICENESRMRRTS